MDNIVLRAMAKWPNVPDVYGWLSLDRRGLWRLRGEGLTHRGAVDFIGRNYSVDQNGRWYFQNGPQRVYVALDYTPWVYRLNAQFELETHTGVGLSAPDSVFIDEEGSLLLHTKLGVGVVSDRDLASFSNWLYERGDQPADERTLRAISEGHSVPLMMRWQGARLDVEFIPKWRVPERFGFSPVPQPNSNSAH